MSKFSEIAGYEGIYFVSSSGQVKRNGKLLKPGLGTNGYLSVALCLNGKSRRRTVHRLVAETFLCRESSKQEVNHRNGDRVDNRIENLEWITRSENIKHSYDVLGRKPPRSQLGNFGTRHNRSAHIIMTSPDGRLIEFGSGLEAKRERGFDHTSLSYWRDSLPHLFKRGKLKGWTLIEYLTPPSSLPRVHFELIP